jgi:Leucine-rich repeat (LRR) protein
LFRIKAAGEGSFVTNKIQGFYDVFRVRRAQVVSSHANLYMRIWRQCCICLVLAGSFSASKLQAASCFSAPSGLIGWWAGDGNALTLVGTNNGTLQGGATATNPGVVGPAFTFDGTNSYVQIADSQILHQTNFTIEAWVRFSSLDSAGSGGSPAGDQYIIFKQNTRTADFEGIDVSKTRVAGIDHFRFLVSSATGQSAEMESATAISTNVWYHLAAVRGSNFTQLYVNGVLERQTNVAFAQDYGTLPLFFGSSGQSFWDHKFKGTLDEVSLYNRVLSAAEIFAIYSATNSGKCKAVNITAQPLNQGLPMGTSAQFTVAATGLAPLTYQWRFNSVDIAGATNTNLTINNIQPSNGGNYAVVVSNSFGAVTSSVAVLAVFIPPGITTQPSSRTNITGTDASFTVAATGTPAPDYQWQFNGSNINGATTSSLTVGNVQTANAGNYTVVITNVAGSITSSVAHLTVWVPPAIGTQPASRTNITGTTANFSVNATGTDPLSYQWQFNGANIGGANGSNLTLNNVQPSDSGNYTIVVTNVAGAITSAVAVLTVWVPPAIMTQPASQTNIAGTDAMFSVTASGTPPPNYQWQFNGLNIAGATSTSVTLSNTQPVNGGSYVVIVTNSAGSITSAPAVLTIWVPPAIAVQPGSATNIAGTTANFSVSATGTPPPSYRWQFNGLAIGDATASTLSLNNVQPPDAGNYTVAITNVAGAITSAIASLTIWVPPSISSPPLSQTVIAGSNAVLTVAAAGTAPLSYEWRTNGITLLDGGNISGADTATLTLTAAQPNNVAGYTVVITNVAGSITSSPAAVLTVNVPPSIIAPPQSQIVTAGSNATITVAASGTLPLSYQWRLYGTNLVNGGNLVGATSPALNILAAQTNNAGPYTIVISNVAATLTSSPPAQLTVNVPPSISAQPQSLVVLVGSNVTFTVGASGTAPLSYQWRSNGTNLLESPNFVGTTTSTLSIPDAQPNQSAAYSVFITNAAASVLSSVANLLVINPDVVVFCDTNLEDTVRLQLGRPIGDVTRLDMLNLNFLCAPDSHITCLGGLEWATNLSTLYLGGNLISDISVLTNFNRLTNLYLCHNLVGDISSLSKLTNLARLDLRWNPTISNFGGVAGLPNLTEAYLGGNSLNNPGFLPLLTRLTFLGFDSNPLTNLTSLAALSNLKGLDLSYNAQADPQQLASLTNLTSLHFSGGGLTNLSFAQNLKQLTNLALRGNAIVDASPLASLSNLRSLNFADNPGLTNLSAFSTLLNLENLWLYGDSIADLGFLASVSHLATLNLNSNLVTSLSPLTALTNLTLLSAEQNLLTNSAGLSGLTNLLSLDLNGNFIVNPTLPQIPNSLRSLSLSSNSLATAQSVSALANLESLNLGANPLTDYSGLSSLSNLSSLSLYADSVSSVSFLRPLRSLSSLDLHGNSITDVSPLSGLTNLSDLDLSSNSAADLSSLSALTALESLDISSNVVVSWNFLGTLTNLNELYAQSDGLSDLNFATSLSNLTRLDVTLNRITNSTPLSALRKLHYFLAGFNRFTDISNLTSLSRLWYVDLRTNLLDVSPGSGPASIIGDLTSRLVSVDFVPQNQPPIINLPTTWPIVANATSSPLAFDVADDVTTSNLLTVTAVSSNLSLIPTSSISLGIATSNRTLTVTPVTGKTGNTLLTLTVMDDTALSSTSSVLVTVVTQQNITVPDLNLRASILSAVGKPSGALDNIDMLKLTQLTANYGAIGDLTGLEWASNLASLSLTGNSISNLSKIRNLPNLRTLALDSNPIIDFSQIAALTNLTELSLAGNSITNIAFVNNLTSLTLLNLSNNRVADISPLIALTNLSYIFLGQNLLTNISLLPTLARLADVDVTLNLLDISSNSVPMAVISTLQSRGALVFYSPQKVPPSINAPTTWRIPASTPSYLGFVVFSGIPPALPLTVAAVSSNPSLLPNANLTVFQNPDGSWTLRAIPLNLSGSATITLSVTDNLGVKVSQAITTSVAIPASFGSQFLNSPNLSWSTWGDAQWFGETTITHDGISAAQSGHITDSQESWLGTSVTGPGRLTFWWRVSSELNFDFLQFYINNNFQTNQLSGEVNWQQQTFNVPAGTNFLRWRYVKDQDTSHGTDAGWLDEVSFTPGVWLELNGPPIAGQSQLTLHAIPGNPYEVQVSTNLVDWTRLALITPTNTATPIIDNAAGNGNRFYRLRDLSLIWFERPTLPEGSVRLVLHSPPNLRLSLLTSTNLTDWTTLATVTNTLGTLQITNSLTTNFSRRFYRAQVAL